jgi:hypothetical protein
MTNLDDVQFTGLKYSRQNNMLVNVRDQVAALANSVSLAALRGDAGKIQRKIGTVTRAMERSELSLAEAVFERGMNSYRHYNDTWGETLEMDPPILVEDGCPYCSRPLVHYRATHPILSRIARDAVVCARCGMIRDSDARSPVADLVIETLELWHCGRQHAVSLRALFRDRARDGGTLAMAAFMANGANNGVSFPAPRTVRIDDDGRAALEVRADVPPGSRMHQEYIRGVVVAEGTLSFVSRPVWVRPDLSAAAPGNGRGGCITELVAPSCVREPTIASPK